MTHSIRDHEAILQRFSDWLTQTSDEVESLAEFSDDESAAEHSPVGPPLSEENASHAAAPGLLQLVEAFTALRHEIKLQTRGTRSLEAAVEQSLTGLDVASREFRTVQAKEREAAERAARPIVEALIGLDEGLVRAARAFQMTSDRITGSAPARLQESLDQAWLTLPRWKRWLNRSWYSAFRIMAAETMVQTTAPDLASLLQGIEQIQLRLSRALQELDIVRLDQPGGLVDPSRMNVIDVVESDTLPAETVVEVVRPGYTFGGRIVRFAEVRAVVGVRSR